MISLPRLSCILRQAEQGALRMLGLCALCALLVTGLSGCAGTQAFSGAVRAGDTVAVAVGWRQNLTKDNITVRITTGSPSNPVTQAEYGPGHAAIRAVINLYPDPVSSLVVSPRIDEDLTPYARTYAGVIDSSYTSYDKDWSQTVVYVDLPNTLPTGTARIWVSGGGYADAPASVVEILPGLGSPISFNTEGATLGADHLRSMGRVPAQSVTFTGSTIPHALQVDLAHNPDRDNGGTGKAYVVNTRGDIKNIAWRDDGTSLRVIVTPTNAAPLTDLQDFKFYVTGGLGGLYITQVKAYDADGNVVTGITAELQ